MSRPDPPAVPDGWDLHRTTRDGVDLAYYRRPGDGPPLLAVHGLTDFAPRLFDLLEALGDYDVLAPDVRGHGRSGAPESGYDVPRAAADLRAVVEDAGVDGRPVVLGHSLGGGIVTSYAARHPVSAVVAIDPVGFLFTPPDDADAADDGDSATENGDGPAAPGPDGDWVTESVESARDALDAGATDVHPAAYASTRASQFLGLPSSFPHERYRAVRAPTLVLRADVDEADRDGDGPLLEQFDDGRVHYVEGAGHVVYLDRPDRTAELVSEFLADAGVAPKG